MQQDDPCDDVTDHVDKWIKLKEHTPATPVQHG